MTRKTHPRDSRTRTRRDAVQGEERRLRRAPYNRAEFRAELRREAREVDPMSFTCDAQLCTDGAWCTGRIDAIVSAPGGAREESVPVGECSADRVQVWHGMSTPAMACGKHATYSKVAVFRGHRNREANR